MDQIQLTSLLRGLAGLPAETEWCEFKRNYVDYEEIGEYISALSNSAILCGQERGYLVWGIDDVTRNMVGTTFSARTSKIGNEELENWLTIHLSPRINFRIIEGDIGAAHFVVFDIPAARHTPVRFKDHEFVRVGTYKKKLRDYPEKERELWARFNSSTFESEIARPNLSAGEVLSIMDYSAYFDLLSLPLPERAAILERLAQDELIVRRESDSFDVTNLGAILFAKDLSSFAHLRRKAVRVIEYKGVSRVETLREQPGRKGYAAGFTGLIEYINGRLPSNELIEQALRREVPLFPPIAIRELVVNALIHQDFAISGTGPMVEIFTDRIEITNPGLPLIEVLRLIDYPPVSRNDRLASFMRRINICEERGSGIDKVITSAEIFQLPAPDFRTVGDHTVAVLYAPNALRNMTKEERIRACYQHAALQWVSNKRMSNASLRKRFGINEENSSQASRIISDTIDARLIKSSDPESTSRKHARYVPFWA